MSDRVQTRGTTLPAPAANFWHSSYFAPLDGLRALSLVLVIGGHIRSNVALKQYLSGGLGVGIFFVLSGFLITTLLLREEAGSGAISLGAFYIRRFFRILPPYFLTVAVYLLVGLIPSQHELHVKFLRGLPYFLSLRNEYIPSGLDVAFTHSWSLSVEEKFYFVWPMLLILLLRKPSLKWLVIPITLLPLFISTSGTLPVAYFSLLLGCCVAIALHAGRSKQEELLAKFRKVPVTLVVAIWAASYFVSINGRWRTAFVITTAALLPVLLLKSSWISKVLSTQFCTWVGKRTYSMYLFHAFCLSAVEDHLIHPTNLVRYIAALVTCYFLSLGVASIVYVVLEKPSISWGRTLSKQFAKSRHQRLPDEPIGTVMPLPDAPSAE